MNIPRRKILLFLLLILILGLAALLWMSCMVISTTPVPAQVWLDGHKVGSTPYITFIFDEKLHHLELKSQYHGTYIMDYTIDAVYDFTRSSMPHNLKVNIQQPFESRYNASEIGWILDSDNTEVYLANLANLEERKPVVLFKGENDPANFTGLSLRPFVSQDGRFVLYAMWVNRRPNTQLSMWLVPVGQPEKRIEVFHELAPMNVKSSVLDLGFSPDNKWIWLDGDNEFAVALLDDPQKTILTWESSVFSWSADGEWLAVWEFDKNNMMKVYHSTGRGWQLFSENISDRPMGFSRDARLLFTYNWIYHHDVNKTNPYDEYEYHPLNLVDVQTGRILASITTKDTIRFVGEPVESPDGKLFALVYYEA